MEPIIIKMPRSNAIEFMTICGCYNCEKWDRDFLALMMRKSLEAGFTLLPERRKRYQEWRGKNEAVMDQMARAMIAQTVTHQPWLLEIDGPCPPHDEEKMKAFKEEGAALAEKLFDYCCRLARHLNSTESLSNKDMANVRAIQIGEDTVVDALREMFAVRLGWAENMKKMEEKYGKKAEGNDDL